jgi:hypothetical protein
MPRTSSTTRQQTASQQLGNANLQASRALCAQTAPTRQTNRTYQAEEKKFKAWVDQKRGELAFGLNAGLYVSKNSVETYYLQEQSQRLVQVKTLTRTCKAIDHLSDREGSTLSPNTDIRTGITGTIVNQVISAVKKNLDDKVDGEVGQTDPHESNPFNVISQENISKVMITKLRQGRQWEDAIICWAITTTTLLRFDSAAAVTLDKLFLINDLPPWGIETPFDGEDWPYPGQRKAKKGDDRMLGILCPPCDQRKKNKSSGSLKTEGVGAYRHKRFERCTSGMLAFGLLQKFELNRGRISFKKREMLEGNQVFWRDFKLFDLSYGTAYDQYHKMLEDAGVEKWLKTTHMRKVGSTLCTAQGLAPQEVRTLSKHSTRQDNFDQSYGCEVSIPVASTIAGFRPNKDPYFVPRTSFHPPIGITNNECTNLLFSDIGRWREEMNSNDGDASKGARHFLEFMLPFFAEVMVQDGMYWTKEFRSNPVVELFLSKLDGRWPGGYCEWARRSRIACKEKILEYCSNNTDERDKKELNDLLQQTSQLLSEMKNQNVFMREGREGYGELERFSPLQEDIPEVHQAIASQEVNLNDSATLRPSNNPRSPTILSIKEYGSVVNLVSQYYLHRHDVAEVIPSVTILGCSQPKMMLSRIKRIHSRVEDHAKAMHVNDCSVNVDALISDGKSRKHIPPIILEAARDIDTNERKKKPLPSYERWLCKQSTLNGKYAPSTRKRKERTRT